MITLGFTKNLGVKLLSSEEVEILECIVSGDDLSSDLYEKLLDHFCNNGEMPYGIAKARDGDPVEWVVNRLIRAASDIGISI